MMTPYLAQVDCRAAFEWYQKAFGAAVLVEPMEMPDGRIGHAELSIAGERVMMSDAHPELYVEAPLLGRGAATTLVVDVDDCDAWVQRAEAAGARIDRRPGDTGHGRIAVLVDTFGHRWMFNGPESGDAPTEPAGEQ